MAMTTTRISAAAAGVILAAAVLLSGCSGSGSSGESSTAADGAAAPRQADSGGSEGSANKDGKAAPAAQPTVTRAIIKTGSLSVEAEDVDSTRQKAIGIITGLRGQVASEDTGSNSEGRITQANLVLKVPTASYETAIDRLSRLGTRTAIHQETSDVTEQVVDVESRIASQRASLERMRILLAKANTIGEIVSVETELTRREADLESLLAKQKNLSLQTELATLSLTVAEKGKTPVVEKEDRGFLAGLRGGWDAFTATFFALSAVLGALLPFLIVLALIGIPLWKFRGRLRRTPAAVPPDQG
ncbi:uncharacterized protein DUF4349 [Kribbella orskensis]|uniref:Uncharacterized protein DUF4349 n=2 Tax=Kribbellaceae TaxID=2726069 RepID=A0ABY2BCE9_9ACTN|nr:uncharacterized protein DUF4349 [Kribbella sp. VKM Ac-2500]TCO15595.1 uncharacterized protein DUF4349 [Kribbella orskensis]